MKSTLQKTYDSLAKKHMRLHIKNKGLPLAAFSKRALNSMENARRRYQQNPTNVTRKNFMAKMQLFDAALKRNIHIVNIWRMMATPFPETVSAYQTVRNTHKKENYNRFIETTKLKTPPRLFR